MCPDLNEKGGKRARVLLIYLYFYVSVLSKGLNSVKFSFAAWILKILCPDLIGRATKEVGYY